MATSGALGPKLFLPDLLPELEEGDGDFPYSCTLRSEKMIYVGSFHSTQHIFPPQDSPAGLVGSWSRNELLCVVHVSGVHTNRRVRPHTLLPLRPPWRVALLLDVLLLPFGLLFSLITVVGRRTEI